MNEQTNAESSPAAFEPSPVDTRLQSLSEQALPRIFRSLLIVSALLLAPVYWLYGWIGAVGFAAGAAVSYLNLRVLEKSVDALAERIVNRQSKEKGKRIVLRFLLRYALVGGIAYAIFRGSALAFRGFLWGLSLPVAAMMIEAAFEAIVAFRKT